MSGVRNGSASLRGLRARATFSPAPLLFWKVELFLGGVELTGRACTIVAFEKMELIPSSGNARTGTRLGGTEMPNPRLLLDNGMTDDLPGLSGEEGVTRGIAVGSFD